MQGTAAARSSPLPLAARLRGLVRLLHPFPTLLNALVAGALACVAVRGWPGTAQLVTLMATMLAIQATIGALNDWADRALDAREKPWKPIPAGMVSPPAALVTAVTFAALAVLLAALDGPVPWLLAMAGLACGVGYDLGLKRTPLSALTYAVALPLVPLWVWAALGQATPALAAVLPVGVLLGVGLQLANALPDAAGDEAAGVRGTLQWLRPTRGRRVAWLAFAAALALALLLAPIAGLRPLPFIACWLIATLLLIAAVGLYRREPSPRSLRRGWTLLAPATGLLAVGWFASLP
jgi:4-hydroxybenzoate polyprenyltransferase